MEVRKVKYTTERFMEEVQKYECLYNKYSKDFRDRNKMSNAWNAVVSQFHDLSQSEAVNKLKNIRSAYIRFLKRKKKHTPSGSGKDAKSRSSSATPATKWKSLGRSSISGRWNISHNFTQILYRQQRLNGNQA